MNFVFLVYENTYEFGMILIFDVAGMFLSGKGDVSGLKI
jgi:hypothetical protein